MPTLYTRMLRTESLVSDSRLCAFLFELKIRRQILIFLCVCVCMSLTDYFWFTWRHSISLIKIQFYKVQEFGGNRVCFSQSPLVLPTLTSTHQMKGTLEERLMLRLPQEKWTAGKDQRGSDLRKEVLGVTAPQRLSLRSKDCVPYSKMSNTLGTFLFKHRQGSQEYTELRLHMGKAVLVERWRKSALFTN